MRKNHSVIDQKLVFFLSFYLPLLGRVMDRNPHLENAHKEATKNRERGKGKERNFEDEFYLEMDLAHRLLSCIVFLFSIFFFFFVGWKVKS